MKNGGKEMEARSRAAAWPRMARRIQRIRSLAQHRQSRLAFSFRARAGDIANDFGHWRRAVAFRMLDGSPRDLRDSGRSLKPLHGFIVPGPPIASHPRTPRGRGHRPRQPPALRSIVRRLDADTFATTVLAVRGRPISRGRTRRAALHIQPGPALHTGARLHSVRLDSPGAGRRSIYRVVWRASNDLMDARRFPDMGLLRRADARFFRSPLQSLAL